MLHRSFHGATCVAVVAVFLVCASKLEAQHREGAIGDGSFYAIDVPQPWNGDLIVYAHGIVDPTAPVALPTTQDGFAGLRDGWLAQGLAVAASSYSENGYALKDAALHTRQLTGLVAEQFGRPRRVYLVGHRSERWQR